MKRTIKKFFLGLFWQVSLFVIILAALFAALNHQFNHLKTLEKDRYLMIQSADMLRQSSDDLTRFARQYVVTGEIKFKEQFHQVLAIRNGEQARPSQYQHIYWDFVEEKRRAIPITNQKISFEVQRSKLPFTSKERSLLKISEFQSNDLVNLELRAFHAMQGRYLDMTGEYTLRGEKDQALAISLLFSEDYAIAKQKIMAPIHEFLVLLETRTQSEIQAVHASVERIRYTIFMMGFIALAWLMMFNRQIVSLFIHPTKSLVHLIKSYKQGYEPLQQHYALSDFQALSDAYVEMASTLSQNYRAMKQLTITDALTGCYNRHFWHEKLTEYPQDKYNAVLLLDIDGLKKINDHYGHFAGDEVLIKVSQFLQHQLTDSDLLIRYGGDEFLIVWHQLAESSIASIGSEMHQMLSKLRIDFQGTELHFGIHGGGVHHTSETPTDMEALVFEADRALQDARTLGMNQVVTKTL